jgi:hypothetical protein
MQNNTARCTTFMLTLGRAGYSADTLYRVVEACQQGSPERIAQYNRRRTTRGMAHIVLHQKS